MRLIDADALMNELNDATGGLEEEFPTDEQIKPFMCGVRLATSFIRIAPTIDIEQIRHGRWVVKKFGLGDEFECMVCSVCGGEALCTDVRGTDWLMQEESNYCPNCGAKMDEEKDDETDRR